MRGVVAPFVTAEGGDQEGLCLVLVKGAGCGSPIIAGDVPAVRDVLTDPCIGTLVDAKDVEQLAGAVIDAMVNPRHEAPERHVAAGNRFDWSRRSAASADPLDAQRGAGPAPGTDQRRHSSRSP